MRNRINTAFIRIKLKLLKVGKNMGRRKKAPGSKTSAAPKSGRVFNIVQYEYSPIDGHSFNFNEQNIIDGVAHQSINRYAYIRHDKDHYSEIDCEEMMKNYGIVKTINDVKPPHWHIVLEVPNKCPVALIAKWFSVPENQVEVPNDRGRTPVHSRGMQRVFIECVGYLTHADIRQQALDKYEYDKSEVKANFEWELEVKEAEILRTKYGKQLSEKEWYRNEVLTNGLRPKDLAKNPLTTTAYTNDCIMLDKLRLKYLRNYAPMPRTRYNYFVYSDNGRTGKGLLSRAFARSLYPELVEDDDIFFCIGGDNVSFASYDGQPVIIYNDVRPFQLLEMFGGRGQLLDSLDIHPVRKDENIKYGSICLTNTVNIINSVIPFQEFFDALAGEYKDRRGEVIRTEERQKEQVYGRFPVVIPVNVEDFTIMLNKGIMAMGSFTEYYEHARVVSHLKKVHETLAGREELAKEIDKKIVAPIVDVHNDVAQHTDQRNDYDGVSDDDILAQFADCGTMVDLDALHNEYNAYVGLWNDLVRQGLEQNTLNAFSYDKPLSYEQWLKQGKPNLYSKIKGFYRNDDTKGVIIDE